MGPLIENVYASKGLYQSLLTPLCRKYDLTDSELIILSYFSNNSGDTASDVVSSQRLKKSVVSGSIKDLVDKNLIEGFYLDGDRRSFHLKLTEDGKDVAREVKKIQCSFYNLITDGLSEEEKEVLKSSFKKINKNIRKYKK